MNWPCFLGLGQRIFDIQRQASKPENGFRAEKPRESDLDKRD
jgi:hypothetical protein